MNIKICRICLSTDIPLQELNEKLLEYFQDICDYSNGWARYLCCSKCKDTLEFNLDFKNKCLKSNKILQEWKRNKSQKKASIQSLHKLLQTSINNTLTKERSVDKTKCENIPELSDETKTYLDSNINDENINRNSNGYNDNIDVKVEQVEIKNDDLFEVIDCGTDHDLSNHFEASDETRNGECVMKNDENDVFNDNDKSDDDKFLIECLKESKSSKTSKNEARKSKKIKTVKNQEKRVYPRKGISEYSQYEAVFDIQLFNTDEDARRELLQRRLSEPYLSAAHRCEMCYTVYKCEKLLQFHMKWHDGLGEFVCDICSMRFAARKALQCHKAKCHRGRFACKQCPLITYYGQAMKAHFQKHEGKIFNCHCGRIFNHISSYLSHARLVHASRHVCVTCARTFVSELGLLNHRLRAHQTKSKVDRDATSHCAPCGVTFASQQVYTVHVLNTDDHKDIAKDMIACPYCGIAFEDPAQLKTHKRQLHPKKKDTNDIIKCKLCEARGAGRTWRRRHYAAAHPHVPYLEEVSEAKLHMCERCGKRFSNICLMKEHVNAHEGVRPYACARCRAAFSSARARAAHAATHARTNGGIRRHACAECGADFKHRAALRAHERAVHDHVSRATRNTKPNTPPADL